MRAFNRFVDKFNRGLLAAVLVAAQLMPLVFASGVNASSISLFNQYDNVGLDWQNGNLQADLFEGDSVPFRAYLDGLTAGPHTLQIAYDNVSNSKHAYDYLTSYDRSFSPDPCVSVITGCVLGTPGSIPAEPTLPGFVSQAAGVVDVFAPSGDNASVDSVVYSSTPGHSLAGGNLQTVVNINFTTDGDEVVLAWGGHIALESEWGINNGASAISGSPYHMRIGSDGLDGQGGSQDRSMKASSVTLFPRITINKIVDGGDAQASDFSFNVSPSVNGQSLYSIASGETSVTIFDVQPDGDYTITENQAVGYSFSSGNGVENCEFNGATATASVAAGTASQVEHAECTFTNSQLPSSIKIIKNTVGGDGIFNFTSDFGVSQLSTVSGTASQTVNDVQPGTYSISETVPTGWNLDSAVCSDGSSVNSIDLEAGENVVCTFTNTKQGSIKIIKNTVGGDGTFDFTSDFGVTQLTTAGGTVSETANNLNPGTYSISETVPAGWDLTSSSCDDGSDPGSISLSAAESVTCTFTNTKRGSITIVKNTSGGDDTFNFTSNFGVSSLTTAGGTESQTITNLVPGSNYNISETVTDGWFLDSSGCDNGTIDAISVDAGQTTTCTFSNVKFGNITGNKYEVDADSSNPTGLAGWTINLLNANQEVIDTTVTDGTGQYAFNLLKPGDYEVVEILQDGWTQIDNDDTCESKYEVELSAGATSASNDFCNFKNGSISGYKWEDLNGDGNVSGEPKLAGWTIFIDENENKTLDIGESSVVTDGNGEYSFTNLGPGTYVICEVIQSGWVQTYPGSPGSLSCHKVVLDESGSDLTPVKARSFGNQGQGTVIVKKNVINDNGGKKTAESDFTFAFNGTSDWTFDQVGEPQDGERIFNNVPAGVYSVVENEADQDGYTTSYDNCATITVEPGVKVTCYITNNDQPATIDVVKMAQPCETDQLFSFEVIQNSQVVDVLERAPMCQNLINIDTLSPQVVGLEDYSGSGVYVDAGTITVSEIVPDNWFQNGTYCYYMQGEFRNYFTHDSGTFEVENGVHYVCEFNNIEYGELIITKFHDYDEDGQWDKNEPTLSDWEMCRVYLSDGPFIEDPCNPGEWYEEQNGEWYSRQTTNVEGRAVFSEVRPGSHAVAEVLQDGWTQSSLWCEVPEWIQDRIVLQNSDAQLVDSQEEQPTNIAFVPAGETTHCYVGNFRHPLVEIIKSNDTTGPVLPGTEVTFTITVTVPGPDESGALRGAITDESYLPVTVSDFLQDEFTYVNDSYSANSSVRGDLVASGITIDPGYTSPGTWILTSLTSNIIVPGEVVTLVYKAVVDVDTDPGTYPTVATVLGYGDTVSITATDTDPDEVIVYKPQVLGTTTLVDTGSSQYLPILIGLNIVLGSIYVTTSRKTKVKK